MFKEKPTKNNLDLKEEAKFREKLVLDRDKEISKQIEQTNHE